MFVCPECGHSQDSAGFCTEHGTALAHTDDELLGTMLGSYRVARLLGRGGMGTVYLGVHPQIGSRVAIKVLTPESSSSKNLVERFFAEALAVNRIHDENIVNVLNFETLPDGRPYIVMEYLEGNPLSLLFATFGPLPLGFFTRLMGDVLEGLGAAHGKGIVHRDLKPDNIFVTAGGRVKILDFGIAKLKGDLSNASVETRAGSLLGTPQYMSPEQARGQPVDHRSDLYSCGVILFEGISGRRPFDAPTLYDLLRLQIEERPPPISALRPDCPPAFESIVARALEKDPALRFQSADELSRALVQAAQFLPADSWNAPNPTQAQSISSTLRSRGTTPSPNPFVPRTPIGSSNPMTPSPTLPASISTAGSAFDLGQRPPPKKSNAGLIALAVGGGILVLFALLAFGLGAAGVVASSLARKSHPARPIPPSVPTATAPATTTIPTPAAPQTAPADDKPLAGRYKIAASTNPGVSTGYTGFATIADKPAGVHTIHWEVAGTVTFDGVGLVRANVFGVGWSSSGRESGVAVYDVAGGKLTGRWALSSSSGFGTEDLDGPTGLDGRYTITNARTAQTNEPYTGSVEIHPKGNAYDVTWNVGTQTVRGTGILEGNVFVAGWAKADGGVVVYRINGTTLEGRWTPFSGSQLGTERLRRQ